MNNNEKLEQQLEKLQIEYNESLPLKINEIQELWKKISQQPSSDLLILFHRKIHNLHGSAGTFGHVALGECAAELEIILKTIIDKPDTLSSQTNKINELLQHLSQVVTSEQRKQIAVANQDKVELNKMIYLLDDDANWGNDFVNKMKTFGFNIKKFDDADALIQETKKSFPGILIININLMDNTLKNLLIDKNSKHSIIFISTSGEFSLRLQAVQMGGSAYFVKPFLIDDLVSQIDRLYNHDLETIRVLILDDEVDIANYYATLLQQANMKTYVIHKALEIDRALHEFNPDLILLDINMPECSGLELAAIVRQQSIYQSTPIIYLSAEEDPLKQLEAMQLGGDDFITKSTQPIFLIKTIRNRVERYNKLRSLIVRDSLTGLYNTSFILHQLEIELKEALQLHNPLSIAIIDIDKFKNINDSYGHQAGDHVIRSLAFMIRKRLRANDIIGRYSGEKFLVILPNTSTELAKTEIDEVRKQFLTLNYTWNYQIFNASFSAGISSFPEFHNTSEMLEAADELLIKAKKHGRNRVESD